jgi:tetratricopeptide (TPR) repeat protein
MKPMLVLAALALISPLLAQPTDCDTLEKCQAAVKADRRSSLPHYRMGEIFFEQKSYQAAANEFRESLNGDLTPKWVEVWAHVNLGKIFDTTGQRDRALNEYRLARRTGDNTRGAQDEAAKYEKEPFHRE